MKYTETKLKDAYIIELDPNQDERGFFARSFCKKEFEKYNLKSDIVQCNVSYNNNAGTLRGMHFQTGNHSETKIVSVTKGAIYDVIIDLRPESKTYLNWTSVELSEDNKKSLYIPEGFAHGFQTLVNDTIVFYQMGNYYQPGSADGIRWNDPQFTIKWPECDCRTISEKDAGYKNFKR